MKRNFPNISESYLFRKWWHDENKIVIPFFLSLGIHEIMSINHDHKSLDDSHMIVIVYRSIWSVLNRERSRRVLHIEMEQSRNYQKVFFVKSFNHIITQKSIDF